VQGVKSSFETVNLILVRENTEDLYSGIEHEVSGGVESLQDHHRAGFYAARPICVE